MTTAVVLNIVIAAFGVALLAAVMRAGYRAAGGALEPRARVERLRPATGELERAA